MKVTGHGIIMNGYENELKTKEMWPMEGTYERKQHFKLYKAKKQWLLAGITALGLLFGSTLVASAATPAVSAPN